MEIKFRGKRIDNGEWVYGYYVVYDEGPEGIKHIIQAPYRYYEVDPETVGQFTNQSDKNGKEAYENDRLCHFDELTPYRVYGVIKFGEILTSSRERHIGFYIEWENDGENLWNEWWRHDLGYWLSQVEIIGTSHENPELLP
jgi:uncharacterized phage protein (TIGR01671 family)